MWMLLPLALPAVAQRVQFPTAAPGGYPSAPPASPYSVAPDPYSVPGAAPAPAYSAPPPTYGAPPPTYSSPSPSTFGTPSASPYTAPAASPYGAPPAAPYSAPAAAPYSVGPMAPPLSGTPYPSAPGAPSPYGIPTTPFPPPNVSPPPSFDPYATGTPMGPPPASVPYTYSPPTTPPPTDFPQQPAPLYPNGIPYSMDSGAPPIQGEEGYWEKTQRFLQELSFEYTYLYGNHNDSSDLEVNRAEARSTFAVPMMYNIETPLLITPGFAFNWWESPPPPQDLPPRTYDAYLDFAWYPRWSPWLGAELGVRPGVWTDFDHTSSDAIRILGRGLASIAVTPQLDVLFGAVYLDRLNVKLLPAGGVYWRPTPEWDAYLVFPNPKVRKHWFDWGNANMFWYVSGEYGGGSWAIDQVAGPARFDYNDIRVIGGIEWETQTQIRGFFEMGYVFDREVLYDQAAAPPTFKPDDTFMLRAGIDF